MTDKNEKETYRPGLESYHGSIPAWFLILMIAVALWGIYYLIAYWGGWGPGIGE